MDLDISLAAVTAVDPLIYCGAAWALSIALLIIRKLKRQDTSTPAEPLIETKRPDASLEISATEEFAVTPQEAVEDEQPVAPIEPIKNKLVKSRSGLLASLKSVFGGARSIPKENLEELKITLIASDIGVRTADNLVKELQESLSKNEEVTEEFLVNRLKEQIARDLHEDSESILETIKPNQYGSPRVVMVVGVNGVGKTTSTAKLAARLKERGVSVLLVAADTFRAAAVKQLQTWGERLDIPVIVGPEECKPQTVVFDAMKFAADKSFDVILIDTAGRLNTKASLMQELTGVRNAVERNSAEGIHEILLVVDGTTGQNAVSQAKEFHSAANLTGIIITKLDGTAKGGVVVAVKNEIGIPIRYVGVGESAADLRPFNTEEFVDALLTGEEKELSQASAHGEVRKRRRRAA